MDIASFDETVHDINRVAGLILSADEVNAARGSPNGSLGVIKNLIRAGNNFLGREHISLALDEGKIAGLVIGYPGRGHDELGTLLRLFLSLRLGATSRSSRRRCTGNIPPTSRPTNITLAL